MADYRLHPCWCRHGPEPVWLGDVLAGSEITTDACKDGKKIRRSHYPDVPAGP